MSEQLLISRSKTCMYFEKFQDSPISLRPETDFGHKQGYQRATPSLDYIENIQNTTNTEKRSGTSKDS